MEQLFTILSILQTETHFHFVVTIFILVILIGFYRYYSVFFKARFPILGKTLVQGNLEIDKNQVNYKTYAIAISISIFLFIVYFLTSPSVYKKQPDGDAVYFSMMVVYADKPADLNTNKTYYMYLFSQQHLHVILCFALCVSRNVYGRQIYFL